MQFSGAIVAMRLDLVQLALCLAIVAGEECSHGDIRMTNSSVKLDNDTYSLAGGVEVCVNSKWATVCQLQWDGTDATVACRQLGLSYAGCEFNSTTGFNMYQHKKWLITKWLIQTTKPCI